MTETTLHAPAPDALKTALHDNLAAAGQTLPEAAMPEFLLAITDETGTMTAGCKGELAFETAHVSELWVHESLRGQGIGSKLLSRADVHARSKSCTRIQIETRNPEAQRLYEAQGYAVFGELKNYDGPNSLVYMAKDL